eukprot:CAMPEP_0182541072 /NCGR_PEP_ID=MMETSP1323-20130603/28089_1 /TAXON_ID=236787 /ORGANISM="Florenciella parvula, Strain RCC1693" /LENGTH=161 /DNA_ID=CAMNT_0024751795 /DNA_START=97 /DNA_END=580 /DNA_ORIENTATION=+
MTPPRPLLKQTTKPPTAGHHHVEEGRVVGGAEPSDSVPPGHGREAIDSRAAPLGPLCAVVEGRRVPVEHRVKETEAALPCRQPRVVEEAEDPAGARARARGARHTHRDPVRDDGVAHRLRSDVGEAAARGVEHVRRRQRARRSSVLEEGGDRLCLPRRLVV